MLLLLLRVLPCRQAPCRGPQGLVVLQLWHAHVARSQATDFVRPCALECWPPGERVEPPRQPGRVAAVGHAIHRILLHLPAQTPEPGGKQWRQGNWASIAFHLFHFSILPTECHYKLEGCQL